MMDRVAGGVAAIVVWWLSMVEEKEEKFRGDFELDLCVGVPRLIGCSFPVRLGIDT